MNKCVFDFITHVLDHNKFLQWIAIKKFENAVINHSFDFYKIHHDHHVIEYGTDDSLAAIIQK